MKSYYLIPIILLILIIPISSAYAVGLPAMNLWDLFVENVFGGFWISVFGLILVMFLILALGGLSAWTNLTYQMVFFLAMSIGYGQALVVIPLWVSIISWATYQVLQYINMTR